MGFSSHLLRGHAVTNRNRYIGLLFVDRSADESLALREVNGETKA
jgi:hypothetical protein